MHKRPKIFLIGAFLPLVWALGFAVFSLVSLNMTQADGAQTSDAIIVLTGGKERIETGLRLFAAGKAQNLFISGVNPQVKKNDILAQWQGDTPLPVCCITIGQEAVTTLGNAQETAAWIRTQNIASIHLVTSHYHMIRALQEFRALMPELEIAVYPIAPPPESYESQKLWRILFEEYHKYLYRAVQLTLMKVFSV